MNIERVRKAVELAAAQPGGLDYQQELDELLELEKKLHEGDYDIWQGDIQVVDSYAMNDLLNMTTYDNYGRKAREFGRDLTFDEYATEVRRYIPTLTDENLQCGYGLIKDLWSDNEAVGENAEDGSIGR
jgi:hypothetical protein